jgi:hypothetical protein
MLAHGQGPQQLEGGARMHPVRDYAGQQIASLVPSYNFVAGQVLRRDFISRQEGWDNTNFKGDRRGCVWPPKGPAGFALPKTSSASPQEAKRCRPRCFFISMGKSVNFRPVAADLRIDKITRRRPWKRRSKCLDHRFLEYDDGFLGLVLRDLSQQLIVNLCDQDSCQSCPSS